MGGTNVFIKGTGFNKEEPTKNSVMIGDYPCIIIEGVTESTLSCQTTSTGSYSSIWNQDITVTVEGQGPLTATKNFDYLTSATPLLYIASPAVNYAGKDLFWYAAHRIYELGDGRSGSEIYGLYVGSAICSRFDIIQEKINPNGGEIIKSYTPAEQKAGKYSLKEHLYPGFSDNYHYVAKSTLDTTTADYDFVVMPAISSFTSSGAVSGNTITVKGSGFSAVKSENTVTVDDVPCTVTTASITELTCTLA